MTAQSLRVVLADDEVWSRRALRVLLTQQPDVDVVAECVDGLDTVEACRLRRPDILFLDVQMPGLDGFEVLSSIQTLRPPAVVLVTAFEEHAVRAFDAEAVDYLLKPFDDDRFFRALERARQRVAQWSSVEARPSQPWLDRIAVESHHRTLLIPVDDIEWIEAQDYYALLHTRTEEHLIRRSLQMLEKQLNPIHFLRIHRKAIVRVEAVKMLERQTHGEYIVHLNDGTRLKASRSHRAQLLQLRGGRITAG
jgi:two-component system LytT family response regulator